MQTKEELLNKFKTCLDLKDELWNLCYRYVEKKQIRRGHDFSDFALTRDDKVALFFEDFIYTTVDIEDLIW